ncbi:MAG: response regulator transcription factor [Bacteroidota bacterium]
MITVLIADDHAFIREGIKNLITQEYDIKVVAETANPLEIIELATKHKPNILILDLSMPGKDGLDVLKEIKLQVPDTKVLIMTMMAEDQFAVRTLKAGASGYLTKDSAPEELIKAIRKIYSGKKYISATLAEKLANDIDSTLDKNPIEVLSDREFQILKLLAAGKSQTDIAGELSLSTSTVNTYRSRILEKLNLHSNAELIHFALTNHLID